VNELTGVMTGLWAPAQQVYWTTVATACWRLQYVT